MTPLIDQRPALVDRGAASSLDRHAARPTRIQPFPIHKGRYDVRPGMRAFGRAALGMEAEEGHFRLDRTTPSYLRQKLATTCLPWIGAPSGRSSR